MIEQQQINFFWHNATQDAIFSYKTGFSDVVNLEKEKCITSIRFLSTESLLRVRVPVLSLHRTSIPAISSIAVILFVMAPCKKELCSGRDEKKL